MGIKDTETKRYISDPVIFADAFNYLLYNGNQVIDPETLKSVDTTEIITPYGNNAKAPVQKYRDNMKIWAAKYDGKTIYVLLGSENQSNVHYAMPVKDMLYDSINYAAQVDAARTSYKGFKFDEEGVRITYTSDEFLSGFHKNDKLIPVITAVIYFGSGDWDAPLSIHEMLDVDPVLLPFIPDYRINLIAPMRIAEEDFSSREKAGKFRTGFGTLMQVLKHQDEKNINEIIKQAPEVDPSSADIIEEIANVKFKRVYTENGGVNMCKGMELHNIDMKIEGAISVLKDLGLSDEEIAERISAKFGVTVEYVKSLMLPKVI